MKKTMLLILFTISCLSCNSQTEKTNSNGEITLEKIIAITKNKLSSDKVIVRERKILNDTLYWRVQTDKKYYLGLIPISEYKNENYSNLEFIPFKKLSHVMNYIKSYKYQLKNKKDQKMLAYSNSEKRESENKKKTE